MAALASLSWAPAFQGNQAISVISGIFNAKNA
jgi:hypothetical protein